MLKQLRRLEGAIPLVFRKREKSSSQNFSLPIYFDQSATVETDKQVGKNLLDRIMQIQLAEDFRFLRVRQKATKLAPKF